MNRMPNNLLTIYRNNQSIRQLQLQQIYLNLFNEDYTIFPVPKLLIQQIIFNVKNKCQQTKYLINDLLQTYCKNWKYYQVFTFNLHRMISKNVSVSLTVVVVETAEKLKYILNKYQPDEYTKSNISFEKTNAVIYTYTNSFDTCLIINKHIIKNDFQLYKAIQHQLIHWMQVALNAQSYTTYGIFNQPRWTISKQQISFLTKCFEDNHNIVQTIQYVLHQVQFEAWCANCVENFQYLELEIVSFTKIIQCNSLFLKQCKKSIDNTYYQQLLMFSQICYLSSKNNPADDRYWYLIQSIKQN